LFQFLYKPANGGATVNANMTTGENYGERDSMGPFNSELLDEEGVRLANAFEAEIDEGSDQKKESRWQSFKTP
jgi:hypothetical protein